MYIQRLKNKYKEILQSSRADQNNDAELNQKKQFNMSKHHPMRVLTQYNQNTHKSNSFDRSSTYIIALKERVAQAGQNLHKKQEEICGLKEGLIRKDQQIKQLEMKISESARAYQSGEKKVIQAKVYAASLQKNIEKLKQTIQALNMDKELIMKQTQYYKNEASKIAKEKTSQQKMIDSIQKTMKQVEMTKSQNTHLKDDIKRMQSIVNDMCQKRISTEFSDKHYLGKPMKEASMWFPQNLVGEVEHFLKKEQVAQGNNKFLNNLVKFINKCTNSLNKSKPSSTNNSRVKSSGKHSHCRSSSMCDPAGFSTLFDIADTTSSIKKTQGLGVSALKKSLMINKYKKLDSKKLTSKSLLISDTFDNSTPGEQILREYRRMLEEVLSEKGVKPKTILDLTDQMISALVQLFQSQGS